MLPRAVTRVGLLATFDSPNYSGKGWFSRVIWLQVHCWK